MSSISQLLKLFCLFAFILAITSWCQITHFAENKKINELDVSVDGLFLLTASDSNTMTIWNTSNFQPIYTYNINLPVLSAKFSKDQLLIGITYAQNNIHILSISGSTFTFLRTITTSHGTVN
jgi:WD40 repeat protein